MEKNMPWEGLFVIHVYIINNSIIVLQYKAQYDHVWPVNLTLFQYSSWLKMIFNDYLKKYAKFYSACEPKVVPYQCHIKSKNTLLYDAQVHQFCNHNE